MPKDFTITAGNSNPTLPDEGFIRLPKVLEVLPYSKSRWWAGVASGEFPKPTKLGPNISAWNVKDIRKLIQDFEAASPFERTTQGKGNQGGNRCKKAPTEK